MRKVTEDFIGTCQACFGEFKVGSTARQIVFHGYRRPGHGHTVGQCPGTDHAPFEYDTSLTVRIIGGHRDRVRDLGAYKAKLQSGEITRLVRYYRDYDPKTFRTIEKSETVEPGHEHWERTLKAEIARTDGDAIYHTRVADILQRMVDEWKPGQIVGIDVPETGKSRALRKAYDPDEADAADRRAKEKAARDAKPGKLKVMFYQPAFARNFEKGDDDGWRRWITAKDEQERQFITTIRAWVKKTITGKSIVRSSYDFDLPRSIRQNGEFDVVSVNLPWEYRDQIATLLPGAEAFETEAKKLSYTNVGSPA